MKIFFVNSKYGSDRRQTRNNIRSSVWVWHPVRRRYRRSRIFKNGQCNSFILSHQGIWILRRYSWRNTLRQHEDTPGITTANTGADVFYILQNLCTKQTYRFAEIMNYMLEKKTWTENHQLERDVKWGVKEGQTFSWNCSLSWNRKVLM